MMVLRPSYCKDQIIGLLFPRFIWGDSWLTHLEWLPCVLFSYFFRLKKNSESWQRIKLIHLCRFSTIHHKTRNLAYSTEYRSTPQLRNIKHRMERPIINRAVTLYKVLNQSVLHNSKLDSITKTYSDFQAFTKRSTFQMKLEMKAVDRC